MAAAAKSLQWCLTLCNPIDSSPPGSSLGFSRQEHWSGAPLPAPYSTCTRGPGKVLYALGCELRLSILRDEGCLGSEDRVEDKVASGFWESRFQ